MAMAEKNRRYKKNILVNKGLQFRIAMMNLLYMFVVMIVTSGVILFGPLYTMFMSSDLNAQYAAANNFLFLARQLIPATMCVFLLLFIHNLFITHRICGPLVNFSHTFRKIAQGDLTRKVTLRKNDYLKNECDMINAMIDGLSGIFTQIKNDQVELIDDLDQCVMKATDAETRQSLNDLTVKLRNNIETLSPQSSNEG